MQESLNIDSIECLYKALNGRDKIKAKALLMLMLRNWLTEVSSFDPVSGHAMHTGIIDFLDAVAKSVKDESPEGEIKDRIYRIVSHSVEAVQAIMEQTRYKILREHAMLPIHAAREFDSNSVQWLSRQPGRTLREKLSGKPYIKAVRRRSSVDTAENRLLRAFLFRLEQILIERQDAFSVTEEGTCEELLVSIQRWLRTEDAAEIGAWGNLPPNNTLLQDKRYRKAWDGWLSLQAIDEQITGDSKRVHRDILSVVYWNTLSLLNHSGRFRTVQQPVALDYDNFSIDPELPVCGCLLPACDAKIRGKIKFIKPDNSFGFITSDDGRDLYFNPYNHLSREIDIDSLSEGDDVSFVIGSNRQGECADEISLPAGIVPVDFNLTGDKWKIQLGGSKYLLQIVSDSLVIEQEQGGKKKLKIETATLKEIPKAIFSLATDATVEQSETTDNQSGPIRVDSSVVDLCSIRPSFTNNSGCQERLPFRLLQQSWRLKNGSLHVVDCGETKAIALSKNIETVSMKSLISHSSTLPDATKSSASMFFTKKLSDYIKADTLTYLVPDWGNDFDLEGIRKSVNFYFDESTPLPKSIAAIFAWQSSKKFVQDRVCDNDFVLVVDSFDGGISITPVQAIYQKDLDETLPETQGMRWERHPAVISPNTSIHTAMAHNLDRNGCQTSKELLHLFGFDGLVSDSGEVSFVKDDHWYHLPGSIREALTQDLDLNILSNDTIRDCLRSTNRDCRGVNVFILSLEDTIREPDLRKEYKWLGSAWSPIKGCQTSNRWQEEVDDIALWRDHLPELSFKDIPQQIADKCFWWSDFNLVKDVHVVPRRGAVTNIPIERTFSLPVNPNDPQIHYRFGLSLGKGKKELRYEAYLKSDAFPLKEATDCKLKMTYTYGADHPYELKFIPLDSAKAGFKSIRVEWRSASEGKASDLENLPVPDFPVRKNWSDFQKFPKENGQSFSDLLDWVERMLDTLNRLDEAELKRVITRETEKANTRIKQINKQIEQLEQRDCGQFIFGKYDRNGDYFCIVEVRGERVFCHSSNFTDSFDENYLYEGVELFLNVVNGKDNKLSGRNISLNSHLPEPLQRKVDLLQQQISSLKNRQSSQDVREVVERNSENVRKAIFSLRFPVLTIWNHGHSLSESDVPDHFRNSILEGSRKIISIIESENMPDTLKEELFFFLCCLHNDAPECVAKRLLDISQDLGRWPGYHRNIAFAIGDAELPWQKNLLTNLLNETNKKSLAGTLAVEGVAIALWRSEHLIRRLSVRQLNKFSKSLLKRLGRDMIELSSNISQERIARLMEKGITEQEARRRERSYQTNTLCKHLELVLALLRSRGIENERVKMIFAPDNDLTKKYLTLVDDISRLVLDNKIKLKSRIGLQIEKPEMFSRTPDLLYALRMYLSGDSGANSIVITGITEEE